MDASRFLLFYDGNIGSNVTDLVKHIVNDISLGILYDIVCTCRLEVN